MVLVIDDEKIVRDAALDVLGFCGVQAMGAANGQEGVRLLQENLNSIQAILLDLQMPIMDGLETLRRLRLVAPNTPVILCSGYEDRNSFCAQAHDPALSYLQKPYSIEQLLSRVCPAPTTAFTYALAA